MKKLIDEVTQLVEAEYGRASIKFGCINNSDHESYAIIKEEADEARDELNAVDDLLKYFWNQVKGNSPDPEKLKICQKLQSCALLAACELIQVAATAKKACITIGNRNIILDLTGSAGGAQ